MNKQERDSGHQNTVEQSVRKSDVVRLLDEYRKNHTADVHTKTILRAIKHDVLHDLPSEDMTERMTNK